LTTGTQLAIPFNRPYHVGREEAYIADALVRGHASGDGEYTRRCAELLERSLGAPVVLLTPSCTAALELAAMTLELGPGDEVVVPAFTFVAAANAVVRCGARPVFCDVRPDTLNLDERILPELVTPATRAVVPTHYAGVGCAMEAITTLAAERSLAVVEDNAHGLFGSHRGKRLGTFGQMAALSFHETKNFTCGEGGALIVNDRSLVDRAVVIRHGGTNRGAFLAGRVDRYTWVDRGSKLVMSDLLAAFLYAQLEARDEIQSRRGVIWERYASGLAAWASSHAVRLPALPQGCEQTYHLFYLLMPNRSSRDRLIAAVGEQAIHAVFHYQPLNSSPFGRSLGGREGQCPVAEDLSQRLVRLPFFTAMTGDEQERVIEAVCAFSP